MGSRIGNEIPGTISEKRRPTLAFSGLRQSSFHMDPTLCVARLLMPKNSSSLNFARLARRSCKNRPPTKSFKSSSIGTNDQASLARKQKTLQAHHLRTGRSHRRTLSSLYYPTPSMPLLETCWRECRGSSHTSLTARPRGFCFRFLL